MQHLRKITSLSEDMAALGLSVPEGKTSAPERKPIKESKDSKKGKKLVSESAQKAAKRKLKAQESRSKRLQRKESRFKAKFQSLTKLRQEGKGRTRPQLRLTLGADKRVAALGSMRFTESALKKVTRKEMTAAFESVSLVAGLLARKFAVLEDLMDMPVMHPDSAYGWDVDNTNVRSDNKTGDVTDYADGKKGEAGEVEEDDMDMDDKKPDMKEDGDSDMSDGGDEDAPAGMMMDKKEDDWQEDVGDDDDKKGVEECDADNDDDEMKEDDDAKDADDKDPMGEEEDDDMADKKADDEKDKKVDESARRRSLARVESMPMDFELNAIRMEAENIATQVSAGQTIGPRYVAGILNDMVSYLGGAMKMYQNMASTMNHMYVGKDLPDSYNTPPMPSIDNKEDYIGLDPIDGESAVDEGGLGNGVVGQTDTVKGGTLESKQKKAPARAVPAKAPVRVKVAESKPAGKAPGKVLPGGLKKKS